MKNKDKYLLLVLLVFCGLIFTSCDGKKPVKGYLTEEEVMEIVNGFSSTTDYNKYSYDGKFQFLGFDPTLIPNEEYKKKDFVDSLDCYSSSSSSYYLRMPLHLTKENWTNENKLLSTKAKIESMLLTEGKTLDKVYYYTDAEGNLIIRTFAANKALIIENPSGVGTVGNAKCGDIMRIYLDIDENGIIQDVKFKTFGCGAAVATSSMATELVIGKTIYEALEVTNKAVMDALDGLPPVKVHCSLLAEEAIHAALWDYAEKNGIKIEGLEKPKNDIHEGEEEESEEY